MRTGVKRFGRAEDEASFHQAIIDNPADHTAALVYADWLDEHDRPALAEVLRRHIAERKNRNDTSLPLHEARGYLPANEVRIGYAGHRPARASSVDTDLIGVTHNLGSNHYLYMNQWVPQEDSKRLVRALGAEGYPIQEPESERDRGHHAAFMSDYNAPETPAKLSRGTVKRFGRVPADELPGWFEKGQEAGTYDPQNSSDAVFADRLGDQNDPRELIVRRDLEYRAHPEGFPTAANEAHAALAGTDVPDYHGVHSREFNLGDSTQLTVTPSGTDPHDPTSYYHEWTPAPGHRQGGVHTYGAVLSPDEHDHMMRELGLAHEPEEPHGLTEGPSEMSEDVDRFQRVGTVRRFSATEGDVNNLLHQIASNPEHRVPGSNLRGVAADALQEQGRDREANVLRNHKGRVHIQNGKVYREYQLPANLAAHALDWHGGGGTALYQIGSSRKLTGSSARRALEEMDEVQHGPAENTGLDDPDVRAPFQGLYSHLSKIERETADEQEEEPEHLHRKGTVRRFAKGKVRTPEVTARNPDEQAFHNQILENGHPDDTSRLVYADWLQDHGENESAARIRWWNGAKNYLNSSRYKNPPYSAGSAAYTANTELPPWVKALMAVHQERVTHDPSDWDVQNPEAVSTRKQGLHNAEMHAYGVAVPLAVDSSHAAHSRLAERASAAISGQVGEGAGIPVTNQEMSGRGRARLHDNYQEYHAHSTIANALEQNPQLDRTQHERWAAHLLNYARKNPPPTPQTATKMNRKGPVRRFGSYRAPAGGMVVRGTQYTGGEMIPDMEGSFVSGPTPTQTPKKARPSVPRFDPKRLAAVQSRIKSHKGVDSTGRTGKNPVPLPGGSPVTAPVTRFAKAPTEVNRDDHKGFLHDIHNNETDRTARGAYADWLEENRPELVTPTTLDRLRNHPGRLYVDFSPKGKVLAIPRLSGEILHKYLDAGFGHNKEFYHAVSKNSQGRSHRVRVSGRMKTWKTRPDEFRVPWKHGLYDNGEFNNRNVHEWLTEDPTGEPS